MKLRSTMSKPKPRHAVPGRLPGRRLATAAAALAAGAIPLAAAGTAAPAATSVPQADLPTVGLPNLALPFGLPDSVDPLTAGVPVVQELPLSEAGNRIMPPLGQLVQVSDLGLLPEQPPAAAKLARAAANPPLAESPQR